MKWSIAHNCKLLRLLTSRITDKLCFHIALSDPITHHTRPLLKATVLNGISCYVVLAVADVTCFITVQFGYQLSIICIESLVFMSIMVILQIVEYYQLKKRHYGEDIPGKYLKVQN